MEAQMPTNEAILGPRHRELGPPLSMVTKSGTKNDVFQPFQFYIVLLYLSRCWPVSTSISHGLLFITLLLIIFLHSIPIFISKPISIE